MTDMRKNRRLVIAHNPHSSRASAVKELVFDRLDSAGYAYETIEVQQAHLDDNVARLAPFIQAGDIVLAAGGDGSAHAVFHTVLAANQPGVELGFLAFGNFNDIPNAFNTKQTLRDPVAFLEQATAQEVWPLNVVVDSKPLRSALLYASAGWTAQAANRFDDPIVRRKLRRGGAGLLKSLLRLGWYYLQTRHKSILPLFRYNGTVQKKTDLIFANGPTVARLFRSGKNYYAQPTFLFRMLNVRWLLPNVPFLVSGLMGRMKGEERSVAVVDFEEPSSVPLQCDGEVVVLEGVRRIAAEKAASPLHVLMTK